MPTPVPAHPPVPPLHPSIVAWITAYGGRWAVYRNHDDTDPRYLDIEVRQATLPLPPTLPDDVYAWGLGARWVFYGLVGPDYTVTPMTLEAAQSALSRPRPYR